MVSLFQKLRGILMMIALMLFFSAVSAFLPNLASIIIIIYFVVVLIFMMLIPQLRMRRKAVQLKVQGRVLLRSRAEETMKLLSKDQQLTVEMSRQMRSLFVMIVIPFIAWGFMTLIRPLILPNNITSMDSLERFARYLVFYGVLWSIFLPFRYIFTPRRMVIPILEYTITTDGIIGQGIVISFPLQMDRYEVSMDLRRGFVEIYDKKSKQAYRFYHQDPEAVFKLIKRYGLGEGI